MINVRLEGHEYPDQPLPGKDKIPTTIANVERLLKHAGIECRFNVIKKRVEMTAELGRPVSMAEITSLATFNYLLVVNVQQFVPEIANRNLYNPVADWILSRDWDGQDRLQAIYDTVTEAADFPKYLKTVLIRRWLLSAVAAALKPKGFRSRGVLTLQGAQGIGKTSWGRSLIPDSEMSEQFFKTDLHMDAGNKDALLLAISHWIAEIGELESSFRKDVSRLKGFLTGDTDKIRPPYAREAIEYPRRTVFMATVNDPQFLVDTTGNSRWWTIPVEKLDFNHGIDMQQLFAQLAVEFGKGEQWWLTAAEEGALEVQNQKHRSVSAIRERIFEAYQSVAKGDRCAETVTALEALEAVGVKQPTNQQCKEAGAALRELVGDPVRIQGRMKWWVQARKTEVDSNFPTVLPKPVPMTSYPEDAF